MKSSSKQSTFQACALLLAMAVLAASPVSSAHAQDAYPTYNLIDYNVEGVFDEEETTELEEVAPVEVANDPLEPMNRAIHGFNMILDDMILEPVARAYRTVIPAMVRERVTNVLQNIQEPVNMINAFLQGDVEHGFTSFWRFVLNSTFGIAGIFDFASVNSDLEHRVEDFGQTLGHYGVGPGPYLVLPIFGPSNFRDAVGLAADIASNPLTHVREDVVQAAWATSVALDQRSRALDITDDIEANALDPYATYRSTYQQFRRKQVKDIAHGRYSSLESTCSE
jgi:phospholipid-binding lipoprotein MlaA